MIVLGIDPGAKNIGYCVANNQEILEKGHWYLKENDIGKRMVFLFDSFTDLIQKYKVEAIAYEKPFMNRGKYVMDIYYATAVIPFVAAIQKLPIYEYSPVTVKKESTGSAKAEKINIQAAVTKFFHLKEDFKDTHSADACAVCITHYAKTENNIKEQEE